MRVDFLCARRATPLEARKGIAACAATAYQPYLKNEDFQMQTLLYYASTLAVGAVAVVLAFGLRAMMHGKSPNLSQKLMRWRVGLQFCAILVIIAYALIAHS